MKKQLQIIETENGWMVTVSMQNYLTMPSGGNIYVYNTVEQLQAALPELLKKSQEANTYAK
jgi:hypothetical protein